MKTDKRVLDELLAGIVKETCPGWWDVLRKHGAECSNYESCIDCWADTLKAFEAKIRGEN